MEKEALVCHLCLVTSMEKEALVCHTLLHMHSKTLKPLNTRRDSKTRRTVSHSELNFYRSSMHGAGKAF